MRAEYARLTNVVRRVWTLPLRARPSVDLPSLLVCLAVTVCAIWLAHRWGPGQDGAFDSAFYIDGSRHLARGDGYVSAWTQPDSHDFAPVIRWAPGFPAMIAGTMLVSNLPPLDAAAIVLAAAYVSAILLILLLSMELLGRRKLALGVVAALVFATQPDTLAALDLLLSDLPFAALALLNTYLALKIARSEHRGTLALTAFGCGLALMTLVRYAATLFVPGLLIAVAITLLWRRQRLLEVLRVLAVPSLVLIASIAIWIARNRQFGPEPFGERHPSQAAFVDMFTPAVHGAFAWWFTARELASGTRWEHVVPVATWLASCTCLVLALAHVARAREELLFTLLPCASYFILMMFVASQVHFDPIEHARFWIPVWPLCFLAVAVLIAASTQLWSRMASLLLTVAIAALLVGQLAVLRRDLPSARQPRGLLDERWQRASTAVPDPHACRLFITDVRPIMLHRELGPTSEIPRTRGDFERAASRHPALCVATLSKRLRVSRTAERRRVEQNVVVDALRAEGRLDQVARSAGITLFRLKKD